MLHARSEGQCKLSPVNIPQQDGVNEGDVVA